MRNTTKKTVFTTSITVLAFLLLLAATASAQEMTGSGQKTAKDDGVSSDPSESMTKVASAGLRPTGSLFALPAPVKRTESHVEASAPQAAEDDETWRYEVRPYIWTAGIYGDLRVNNTTAQTGKGSTSILGMLDFTAAAQVEAIRGRWRLMFDENYVNLGTTGTGPGGNVTLDVQPTMNIFEAGGSYTAVTVRNKKATVTNPLPPIFRAEVLGGVRWFHLGLGLQANNNPPVEGSRNLVGPFVGSRLKVSPHKAVTLIGKFTVGSSGAGANLAWSGEGLVDLRLKKSFSLGGGYRVLDMNADQPGNRVGFNGQLRGLLLTMTLYR